MKTAAVMPCELSLLHKDLSDPVVCYLNSVELLRNFLSNIHIQKCLS